MQGNQPVNGSSWLGRLALFAGAAALAVLASCGGNDTPEGTNNNPPAGGANGNGVTGTAYLGAISGGSASLYNVGPNGANTGAAVETVTTDANGKFTFTNSITGPARICVTGGTYTDEATGTTQTSTLTLCALVGAATSTVYITPMTIWSTNELIGVM